MIGAIIGDIAGSRFEFNNTNDYNFELFTDECSFTDDTICTVAIGYALVNSNEMDYKDSLRSWGGLYPNPMGAYGGSFGAWLRSDNPQPYNSFGNGSAMRVSPIAWWFDTLDEVLHHAELSALPTHNHPEGVKGAKSVAHAIFALSSRNREKDDWKDILCNVANLYYPDFEKQKFVRGRFDETCMGTVPLAFQLVLKSTSFEDAIRKAISFGGDSDTLGAIVGSIAEAIWEIPSVITNTAICFLPAIIESNVADFYKHLCEKKMNYDKE